MKLHLPVRLFKSVLACLSAMASLTVSSGVAWAEAQDLTLDQSASLIIDYADSSSIIDLDGGILTLSSNTALQLSGCGTGDGRVYDLVTGISALKDAAGNAINLDSSNNAIANYFDTTLPGSGFWADATLQMTADGTLQLVRHNETVKDAITRTTRRDGSVNYSFYESVTFENINYSSYAYGGAIYANEVTLSGNGAVTFSGNTAFSENSDAQGGAIYADCGTVTLSGNGAVTFSGSTASGGNYASGGAIYAERGTVTLSGNGAVTFSGNTASGAMAFGGAIYASSGTVELSGNGAVTFSGNTASSEDWAYGGAIYARSGTVELSGNGAVTFSGNTASGYGASGGAIDAGVVTLSGNGEVTFSGNTATRGGAIYANEVTLSGNENVTFSGNTAYGAYYGHGGAIYAGVVTLSGNENVTFSGNTASGANYASGGAIDAGYKGTLTLSDNEDVTFSGNTASSTSTYDYAYAYGGAIYAEYGTVTLSGNGEVTFSGNTARSSSSNAYGGAINASDVTLSGNGDVLFEKNAEVTNDTYRLRSIYTKKLNLAASADKKIEFRDSIYASGTVNLNADYMDAEGVVHKQTGDIIFTGATTEADLLAVKGSAGTADEITNSRTSMVEGTTTLYGGRLRIEDGAVYQGRDIIVEDGANATLMLKNGTVDSSGYSITIGKSDTLSVTGESSITADTLVMKAGSNMEILLTEANETGDAALTLTGSLSNEGMTLVLPGSEYLALGTYKLLTSAEEYDFSGWTLSGATTEQLSWIDGTLCYTGGHEWNYMLSEGDTIQDSYTGNVIINGGNITLSKSLAVNAIAGVEKTGNLVVNKGSVSITSGNTLNSGLVVKNGHVSNQGTITKSITLEGGTVYGSGSFAGLVMTGGILVVGNSPGVQSYTGAADLQSGKVVFSVAGNVAASEGNTGWESGAYSVMDMNNNALTLGADVRIVIELGGAALYDALMATDANPLVFEDLAIAINISNTEYYTETVLASLAENITFVASSDAAGIVDGVTLAPGTSLDAMVQEYSLGMQNGSIVLNFSVAGNGTGLIPEPTTATLSLLALAALAARRRRK